MRHRQGRALRVKRVGRAMATLGVIVTVGAATTADAAVPLAPPDATAARPTPEPAPARADLWFVDSLVGHSGKLRALFVSRSRPSFAITVLEQLFGDSAVDRPGIYTVDDSTLEEPVSLISMVPFSAKQKGRIGGYRLGFWPHERRPAHDSAYDTPDGFVEVTPENEDTHVSEHFELRDFLTHDQEDVWPKYLVLSDKLIDKLELVIQDLDAHGIPVEHLTIMSGFRTPEYNRQGVGRRGGRALDSRHQYGDAADVYVDNDGTGRMNDLNHDGRVNLRDARIILQAVDRVEAEHPDLVGGAGLYRATRAHGPFVHVDTRGERVRWGVR